MKLVALVLLVSLHSSTAHVLSTDKKAAVMEIGREEQGGSFWSPALMRSAQIKAPASLIEAGDGDKHRPYRRAPAEAAEAFASPSKIDDSFLHDWSPRMPSFIEKYPWFYAASFVGGSLVFLLSVCSYVYYEDSKDEARRELMRNMRRRAAAGGYSVPQRMGASFAPRPAPSPSRAQLQAAAEDSDNIQVEERIEPEQKARVAQAFMAAENGMARLSNAVGNFTGSLIGETAKFPKSSSGSTEPTASGASTPRSQLSSQHSSTGTAGSSRYPGIRSGTLLVARVPEVIFASSASWQEIGELAAGQQVVAAGPPEVVDNYTMVPIKPRGAVDVKTLQMPGEY